jgi:hypothetical protein
MKPYLGIPMNPETPRHGVPDELLIILTLGMELTPGNSPSTQNGSVLPCAGKGFPVISSKVFGVHEKKTPTPLLGNGRQLSTNTSWLNQKSHLRGLGIMHIRQKVPFQLCLELIF